MTVMYLLFLVLIIASSVNPMSSVEFLKFLYQMSGSFLYAANQPENNAEKRVIPIRRLPVLNSSDTQRFFYQETIARNSPTRDILRVVFVNGIAIVTTRSLYRVVPTEDEARDTFFREAQMTYFSNEEGRCVIVYDVTTLSANNFTGTRLRCPPVNIIQLNCRFMHFSESHTSWIVQTKPEFPPEWNVGNYCL